MGGGQSILAASDLVLTAADKAQLEALFPAKNVTHPFFLKALGEVLGLRADDVHRIGRYYVRLMETGVCKMEDGLGSKRVRVLRTLGSHVPSQADFDRDLGLTVPTDLTVLAKVSGTGRAPTASITGLFGHEFYRYNSGPWQEHPNWRRAVAWDRAHDRLMGVAVATLLARAWRRVEGRCRGSNHPLGPGLNWTTGTCTKQDQLELGLFPANNGWLAWTDARGFLPTAHRVVSYPDGNGSVTIGRTQKCIGPHLEPAGLSAEATTMVEDFCNMAAGDPQWKFVMHASGSVCRRPP